MSVCGVCLCVCVSVRAWGPGYFFSPFLTVFPLPFSPCMSPKFVPISHPSVERGMGPARMCLCMNDMCLVCMYTSKIRPGSFFPCAFITKPFQMSHVSRYRKVYGSSMTVYGTSMATPGSSMEGLDLELFAQGASRRVFKIKGAPNSVAKVMPARGCELYQGEANQPHPNELEYRALMKLNGCQSFPQVIEYKSRVETNKRKKGNPLYISLLIVTQMGDNMETLAKAVTSLADFTGTLQGICVSLKQMAEQHVWLPNAYATNMCADKPGGNIVVPCDFKWANVSNNDGQGQARRMMKAFFRG